MSNYPITSHKRSLKNLLRDHFSGMGQKAFVVTKNYVTHLIEVEFIMYWFQSFVRFGNRTPPYYNLYDIDKIFDCHCSKPKKGFEIKIEARPTPTLEGLRLFTHLRMKHDHLRLSIHLYKFNKISTQKIMFIVKAVRSWSKFNVSINVLDFFIYKYFNYRFASSNEFSTWYTKFDGIIRLIMFWASFLLSSAIKLS